MDNINQDNNLLKGYNMLLYFAGSMIMYEPSEECIMDFWTKGNLKNLPVSSSNPNFIKAASQLRNSCTDKSICGKMLREDYIRLFGRQELPLAPPYESLYNSNRDIILNLRTPSVTEFYNSYGWQSKFRGKIDDDHLGIELLFLTILIEKYLELEDQACMIEMKREISRFIDQHILYWIPAWNENIQQNAKTLCYKGIGTLLFACIEDIFNYFEQKRDTMNENSTLKN
ncbi:MAG TPA: molecular chaperone TorD family protein [Bacteroidales bacterium]|nr:molecular chaperone TorD family protein [Bacteroidales bacterium]